MAYRADTGGDRTFLLDLRTRFFATQNEYADQGWTVSGCRIQNGTTGENIENIVFPSEKARRDYELARTFFCLPDDGLVRLDYISRRRGMPLILRADSLNAISNLSNTQLQNIELSNYIGYRQERFVAPNGNVYPPKLPVYYE